MAKPKVTGWGNRYCLQWRHIQMEVKRPTIQSIIQITSMVVQLLRCVWLFVTPWTAPRQVPLSFTLSQSLFKLISTEVVMLSNQLILCCPLLLLPSTFPNIRAFSNESDLHISGQSTGASTSASFSPSNEYSRWTSFRIDWFDLLAVQGTHSFQFFSYYEPLRTSLNVYFCLHVQFLLVVNF